MREKDSVSSFIEQYKHQIETNQELQNAREQSERMIEVEARKLFDKINEFKRKLHKQKIILPETFFVYLHPDSCTCKMCSSRKEIKLKKVDRSAYEYIMWATKESDKLKTVEEEIWVPPNPPCYEIKHSEGYLWITKYPCKHKLEFTMINTKKWRLMHDDFYTGTTLQRISDQFFQILNGPIQFIFEYGDFDKTFWVLKRICPKNDQSENTETKRFRPTPSRD